MIRRLAIVILIAVVVAMVICNRLNHIAHSLTTYRAPSANLEQ
jgi:hypothetical protein